MRLLMNALWVVPLSLAIGCTRSFDTTRKPVDTGSFGQSVYTLACKRVAYLEDLKGPGPYDVAGDKFRDTCREGGDAPDAPARLKTLMSYRDRLIAAVNAAIPPDFRPKLQSLLVAMTTLYDDDTVQHTIDKAAEVFDLMIADDGFLGAMAHFDYRLGYRPLAKDPAKPMSPSVGLMGAISAYPDLDQLLRTQVTAVAVDGSSTTEFKAFMKAMSETLQGAELLAPADAKAADRSLTLALNVFFTEDATLSSGKVRPIVVRDYRGLATVNPAALNDPLKSKFVDKDRDGLADINADGKFVDTTGAELVAPTPFATPNTDAMPVSRDADGRALMAPMGAPLYVFRDLDRTVLAGLTREAVEMFNPMSHSATKILRGASALLGARNPAATRMLNGKPFTYRGYDTTASPLLDVLYGYYLVMQDPNMDDTLQIARALLAHGSVPLEDLAREWTASRLINAFLKTSDIGKAHPESFIPETSTLYDDLVPIITRIMATPGLTEDLLRAMEKPEVKGLGPLFVKYMTYKDRFDIRASDQAVVGAFATPVDRTAADSGFNRSVLQRLLHLIADSNGVRMCSKAGATIVQFGITVQTFNNPCDLFQVDDLAVFYIQSIVYQPGTTTPKAYLPLKNLNAIVSAGISLMGGVDSVMESQSGIAGFTSHPTPQALNRVLFLNPMPTFLANTTDPARCKDGERFIDAHAGTLPVWEGENFYGKMRPIMQAFANHNQEKILVDLFSVLHKHYPDPQSLDHQFTNPAGTRYAAGSGVVRYETQLIDTLTNTELLDALVDGAPTIDALQTAAGKKAPEVLAAAGRWLLTPNATIKTRTGQTMLRTADDKANVTPLSPYLVLAQAYKEKRAVVTAGGEAIAWQEAVSSIVDQLFKGEKVTTPSTYWRFRNRRVRGLLLPVIDLLRGRLAAHKTAGDLGVWLNQTLPADTERIMTHPVFAAAADFVLALNSDPAAKDQIDALMAYLTDELAYDETFQTTLSSAADILQMFVDDPDLVPVARMLGKVMSPDLGFLDQNLLLMKRSFAQEDAAMVPGTLAGLIRNLFREHVAGRTPLSEIIEAVHETNRERPGVAVGSPFSLEDFRSGLQQIRDFLADNKRGLRKFIDIVKMRKLN